MTRALAIVLLLACVGLQGCATGIIGGAPAKSCKERDPRNCPQQET